MDFEDLFVKSIYKLMETTGGSLEEALDSVHIFNEEVRQEIKEYLCWDNE